MRWTTHRLRASFKPNLEAIEDRVVPALFTGIPADAVVIAPEGGGIPKIKIVNPTTGEDVGEFQAYEDAFRGGVNVAVGDVTGDGVRDLVIAPGTGGGPRIRIVDGKTGIVVNDFFVYEANFRGGVTVALGDVNGDGRDEIIAGTGKGGGPRVRILDGATLGATTLRDFFAYEPNFRGGVLVASGDINGDGKDDVITGTGVGGGPRVTVFNGTGTGTLKDFFAYDDRFRGGVLVGSGDVNGDGKDDVITGTGPGGGAVVRTFSGANTGTLNTFFSDDMAFRGGVRVGSDDLDGNGRHEIISRTRHGNEMTVRIFDDNGQFLSSVGRMVDDNPSASDSVSSPGGTIIPGTVSSIEGKITAVNAALGTVDILLANGSTVVVQAGPGTKIERNDAHTTLATFVVGEKGEAVIGPNGIAWEIEAEPFSNGGGSGVSGSGSNGTVIGKIEGVITAINAAAGQVTIQRLNGTSVVVTAAVGAVIERNDIHTTLASFVVGDRGEALIGANGLATKIEAYTNVIGGGGGGAGSGGTINGVAPPAGSEIEGTITGIDVANNRVTIRNSSNQFFLIQVLPGTKVERNDNETSIASFKLNDFGQAKTNLSGLTWKLEAVGP